MMQLYNLLLQFYLHTHPLTQINPSMLKLQHIQIQLASRSLTAQSRKHLRISIGNIVKSTVQPGKFLSEQSLQWTQSLAFPILYNKEFMFQIYQAHQFGYNERELEVMEGRIVIDSVSDTRGTWEIYDSSRKKIGYLSAEIVSKVPAMMKSIITSSLQSPTAMNTNAKNTNPQQHSFNNQPDSLNLLLNAQPSPQKKPQKTLRITSIVSRTPSLILKRAYITVDVGGQSVQTAQLRSRAGELVYIEPRSIGLAQGMEAGEAVVRIVAVRGEDEKEVVAEGVLPLGGSKPAKKVMMMKDGVEVGQVYIQSKIVDKSQINNSSYISTSRQPQSKLELSSSYSPAEQSFVNQPLPRTKSTSPGQQPDYTKLQHFGINSSRVMKASLLDSSMVSTTSARRRNSVLAKNNNIVFPREKRFMIYQDRQNQRISYLNQRSFQYRTEKTGGRYRGASIGYGDKTDFTRAKRENPGVGNYKLPSIWDRY